MSKPKPSFKAWEQQELTFAAEQVLEKLDTIEAVLEKTGDLPPYSAVNTMSLVIILKNYMRLYNFVVEDSTVDPLKLTKMKVIH